MNTDYAVRFDIDYPDRELNRATTFFRVFVAIPILIIGGLVAGGRVPALQARALD